VRIELGQRSTYTWVEATAPFSLTSCSRRNDTGWHRVTPDETRRHVAPKSVPGRTSLRIRCPKGRGSSTLPSRTPSDLRIFVPVSYSRWGPRKPSCSRLLTELRPMAAISSPRSYGTRLPRGSSRALQFLSWWAAAPYDRLIPSRTSPLLSSALAILPGRMSVQL
jgi:hypothetical protein